MRGLYGRTGCLAILLLVTAASACVGQPPTQQAPQVTTSMVPMRDRVKLATDVYLPGDGRAEGLFEQGGDVGGGHGLVAGAEGVGGART